MYLGPISYVDCLVFLIFLAPQLILRCGLVKTFYHSLRSLPFLVVQLPYGIIKERYLTRRTKRTPFSQHATLFQDAVVRCVKYTFAEIPPSVGRVFFSRDVVLPFLRFRMLRHGYLFSPIYWKDINRPGLNGIWIAWDELEKPDIVIYYSHGLSSRRPIAYHTRLTELGKCVKGGGFSMGSSHFYLEFLMAWVRVMKDLGYSNPCIFALEYTLVPDQIYPTQVQQVLSGYRFVLSKAEYASRICLSGDSAGATLILSLLLHNGFSDCWQEDRPGLAVLISPWVTIVSSRNRDTPSDYLNTESLHSYARQFVGMNTTVDDPLASPGKCEDLVSWRRASPLKGFICFYGSEEVFQPEIARWVGVLRRAKCVCDDREEQGGVHAWPIVAFFTGECQKEQLRGLFKMSRLIKSKIS